MEKVFKTNKNGLWTIDEQIYAPMFGFKDRQEYYKECSLSGQWNRVKVPTLSLSALDDVLCTNEYNPNKEIQAADCNVIIATTKTGNHSCHVDGKVIPKQWFDEPLMEFYEFLEARHKFKQN